MAGRKRRKMKLVAETLRDKRTSTVETEEPNEQQTASNLPVELIELIVSRLTLKENICASVVCKRWLQAAVSVRVVKKPPWLMFFSRCGDLFEFYDPLLRKSYWLELEELRGCRACYAKDGWLLLYRSQTRCVFFFNPYTKKLIELPSLELTYQIVAFSCAPTSASCIVFTVKHISPTLVAISTWCPGATEWTTVNYQNRLPFVSSMWNKSVYCNGFFYCLSITGWLGVYDPQGCTWVIRVVPPPRCPVNFFVKFVKNWWKGYFMAENNGDIYVIYTSISVNPVIYKLDQINNIWVEMTTIGSLTLFASSFSSHAMTDLLGMMRNSIFFSKVRFYGRRCVSFSLGDGRYYPRKQCYDWGEQDPFESIWIEPPEDISIFV